MIPVIIPVLNGLHLTRECVKSVLAQDVPCEIWIIDNGSVDGTREWLFSLANDRVRHVAATLPSVAASWNFGLNFAFGMADCEAAWVINNDTKFRPDSLRHLLAADAPFVTLVGKDDPHCIDPPYDDPDPAKIRPHPDFSCFLIRKECFVKVGPFDEDFIGGYAEDASYHVRLHRAGITAVAIEMPFYHLGAGTIKCSDPEAQRKIQLRADANRALFKQKYGVAVGSAEYYALFGHGEPTE